MEPFIAFILFALVLQALDRNRARQSEGPRRLAGSTDIQDRDVERLSAELSVRL
jgi:hypothetical protein